MVGRGRNWLVVVQGVWLIASVLWIGVVGNNYVNKHESRSGSVFQSNVSFLRDFAIPAVLGPGIVYGLGAGLFLVFTGLRREP